MFGSTYELVDAYLAADRNEDATRALETLLQDLPRFSRVSTRVRDHITDRLADLYLKTGDAENYIALLQTVVARRDREASDITSRVSARRDLAHGFAKCRDWYGALRAAEQALQLARHAPEVDPQLRLSIQNDVAIALQNSDRLEDAIDVYRDTVDEASSLSDFPSASLRVLVGNLSRIFEQNDRSTEAIPLLERLYHWHEDVPAGERADIADRLVQAYVGAKRFDDAIAVQEVRLAEYSQRETADIAATLSMRNNLAAIYMTSGKPQAGARLFEEVVEVAASVYDVLNGADMIYAQNLAAAYEACGDSVRAVSALQDASETLNARGAADSDAARELRERIESMRRRDAGPQPS